VRGFFSVSVLQNTPNPLEGGKKRKKRKEKRKSKPRNLSELQ
jgi:hypothetical protein